MFARLLLQSLPQGLQIIARAEAHLPGLPTNTGAKQQPGERVLLALLDLWLDRSASGQELLPIAICSVPAWQQPVQSFTATSTAQCWDEGLAA